MVKRHLVYVVCALGVLAALAVAVPEARAAHTLNDLKIDPNHQVNDVSAIAGKRKTVTMAKAIGGSGPRTFTLTGANNQPLSEAAPKVSFSYDNSRGRMVINSTQALSVRLTYTITDDTAVVVTEDFQFTVTGPKLPVIVVYRRQRAGSPLVHFLYYPEAIEGTGPFTYSMADEHGVDISTAIPGVLFDGETRTISGRPTIAKISNMVYRVVDRYGNDFESPWVFSVTGPVFNHQPVDRTFIVGDGVNVVLPRASGSSGALSIRLNGPDGQALGEAVPGLNFTSSSRQLSGVPSKLGDTSMTYTVTDRYGNFSSEVFTYKVLGRTTPKILQDAGGGTIPQGHLLNYVPDQRFFIGEYKRFTLQVADGLDPADLTHSITGPQGQLVPGVLPGLSFEAFNHIVGTPTALLPAGVMLTYLAIGKNTSGNRVQHTRRFKLFVSGPKFAGYSIADRTLAAGAAVTIDLPSAANASTYRLTGPNGQALAEAVPGLSFSIDRAGADHGVVRGTPTRAERVSLTYRATNAAGHYTELFFDVTVTGPMFAATSAGWTRPAGAAWSTQLPIASGAARFTYSLTGANGRALADAVPGMGFDASSGVRRMAGTPSRVGATSLTYSVVDRYGNIATDDFVFTVSGGAGPTIVTPPTDRAYTTSYINAASFQLSTATGTGPFTYALSGQNGEAVADVLLDGDFDPGPSKRRLSFSRVRSGVFRLLYIVTDAAGRSTAAGFNIVITGGPIFSSPPADRTYTVGSPRVNWRLPAGEFSHRGALSNIETLVYSLRGANGESISDAMPGSGASFDAATRRISIRPTRAGVFPLVYRVGSSFNGVIFFSRQATFTITILGPSVDIAATPRDRSHAAGATIPPVTLPPATGHSPLTYAVTGPGLQALKNAAPGVVFNPATRVLSGVPTTVGTVALTYGVTDAGGRYSRVLFNMRITGPDLGAVADRTYASGTQRSQQLSIARSAAAPLTYTLMGENQKTLRQVALGMAFDGGQNARRLAGVPTKAGRVTLTYGVTDTYGNTDSTTFVFTVAGPTFNRARVDWSRTAGVAWSTQLPAATGAAPLTYALSGPNGSPLGKAVVGMGFDARAAVRRIAGTPGQVGSTSLTYSVTDRYGNIATDDFVFAVTGGSGPVIIIPPINRSYYQSYYLVQGFNLSTANGDGPFTYALTGPNGEPPAEALPDGSFDSRATERRVSLRRNQVGTYQLVYTVTDRNGRSTAAKFKVTINGGPHFVTPPADRTFTVGGPKATWQLPHSNGFTNNGVATGYEVLMYTLTGPHGESLANALPDNNASFDAGVDARRVSITPTRAGVFPLRYRVGSSLVSSGVADEVLSRIATFTITILGPNVPIAVSPGNRIHAAGATIAPFALAPAATGHRPLSYALTGAGTQALGEAVPGLAFNPATRMLSGTPTRAEIIPLTYGITDAGGQHSGITFNMRITGPMLNSAVADYTYVVGELLSQQLPDARSAAGSLTYSVLGANEQALAEVAPGMSFDGAANARQFAGTPTRIGSVNLTYRVSDRYGNITDDVFAFAVTGAGPSFAIAQADLSFAADSASRSTRLRPATGDAPLTYALTGANGDAIADAIPGGQFDATAATRRVTFSRSTAGVYPLRYSVTDTYGISTTSAFTITISGGPSFASAQAGRTFTAAAEVYTFQMPTASGTGTGALTYALTGPGGEAVADALPNGGFDGGVNARRVSFSRHLSGIYPLRYRATDSNGLAATASFNITIVGGPRFDHVPADRTFAAQAEAKSFQLSAALGDAPFTYTLSGADGETAADALPDGGFDAGADARRVVFSRNTPGDYPLRYTIADANGLAATANFNVAVTGPIFNAAAELPDDLTSIANVAIADVTLPLANSALEVTYAVTGAGGVTLAEAVPGLVFDATTLVLGGTPTTPGVSMLFYTATDVGGVVTATFTATITGPRFVDFAVEPQNHTAGSTIDALTLPVATDGIGAFTYSLEGPNNQALDQAVPGLSFDGTPDSDGNAASRVLSGTPSMAGSVLLTYIATDSAASPNRTDDSATFMVSIGRAFETPPPATPTYAVDSALEPPLTLPAVTGGAGALVYALSGALPDGLSFDTDASARVLSGTPTVAGVFPLEYSVSEGGVVVSRAAITLTITHVLPTITAVSYPAGMAIGDVTLPPAAGGGSLTYALSNAADATDDLPAGLDFDGDATARILSGTPTAAGVFTLNYTASIIGTGGADDIEVASTQLVVTVTHSLATITGFAADAGVEINMPLPQAAGGGNLAYAISGTPDTAGLSLNGRTLVGTPTTAGAYMLTYAARLNDVEVANTIFTLSVNHALPSPEDAILAAGTVVSLTLPEAAGGGDFVYGLTGVRPPGLATLSGRVLSGVPTTPGDFPLVYTADQTGIATLNADFTLTIGAMDLQTFAIADQEYAAGTTLTAATGLSLPQITGHDTSVVYGFTATTDLPSGLPAGLAFTASDRFLGGTPTAAGVFPVTYTARRSGVLIASGDFTITVNHVLEAPGDEMYAAGDDVNLTLPLALGDPDGDLAYAVSGTYGVANNALPDGLIFTAADRLLSGRPTVAGAYSLNYAASQTIAGVATSVGTVNFTVTVNFALPSPEDAEFAAGSVVSLTLPEALGGGDFVYGLTGDRPPGLATLSGRVLSGVPTATGDFQLVYTADQTGIATLNADFTLTIGAMDLQTFAIADQEYAAGTPLTAATGLSLPQITGHDTSVVYGFTATTDLPSGLPAGLAFTASDRFLGGTPTAAGVFPVTYTARRSGVLIASGDFTITVNHVLVKPDDRTYAVGDPVNLTLERAIGDPADGSGPVILAYALTGTAGAAGNELPAGLIYDGARRLHGNPTVAGAYSLTYAASQTIGGVVTSVGRVNFTVTITAGDDLAFTITDQTYPAGSPLSLTLPSVPDSDMIYTLAGAVPTGLSLSDRVLGGTPTVAGEFTMVYSATRGGVTIATATFTLTIEHVLPTPDDEIYAAGSDVSLTLPLALGDPAGDLVYGLTAAAPNDALPPNLAFTAASRVLAGIPSTPAAAVTLIYTASQGGAVIASVEFRVTIGDANLQNLTVTDQTYPAGSPLSLTLPSVPDSDMIYTLAGAVPTGLSLSDRILGGTPTVAGEFTMVYSATRGGVTIATATFTLTIEHVLPTPGDEVYAAGSDVALTLPLALGDPDGDLAYALTGTAGPDHDELPAGLEYTAASRVLAGIPTVAAAYTLTYAATDGDDEIGRATFMVIVNYALPTPGDEVYAAGSDVALTLPLALGDPDGDLVYGLTAAAPNDALPPNLAFTAASRVLAGIPSTPAAAVTLIYTASQGGAVIASVEFRVTIGDANLQNLTVTDQTYPAGSPLSLTLPSVPDSDMIYTLAGAVPTGLSLSDRVLGGTPTVAGEFTMVYSATRGGVTIATATFTLTIEHVLPTPGDESYAAGSDVALTLPLALGDPDGDLAYALTGTDHDELPAGLEYTAASRVLAGIPSTPAAAVTLLYTARQGGVEIASVNFTVTISSANVENLRVADQTYAAGRIIDNLTLPSANGDDLVYTLGDVDGALPAGLSFAAGAQVLSGTPTRSGAFALSYTATRSGVLVATANFTAFITGPSFAASVLPLASQTYTAGAVIAEFTLPVAGGDAGAGPRTYTLTGRDGQALGEVVPGLVFNATNRVLYGTPSTVATLVDLTYRATDKYGNATADALCPVTILRPAALVFEGGIADQTYAAGAAVSLTLPPAVGGGVLMYELTGGDGITVDGAANLLDVLGFDDGNRVLSGTAPTAATEVGFSLTYTATQAGVVVATAGFTVTITGPVFAADDLPLMDQTYYLDMALAPPLTLPLASGAASVTYTLVGSGSEDTAPNLPAGLIFDDGNRTLSGTPSEIVVHAVTLTYTATDDYDNDTAVTFTVTVRGRGFEEDVEERSYTYTVGEMVALTLPYANGRDASGALVYALAESGSGRTVNVAIPGLSFDSASRALSGEPSTPVTAVTMIYTATEAGRVIASAIFTITITTDAAFAVVNEVIVPEVAAAISRGVAVAVSGRIERANAGNIAGFSLSGSDNLAAAISAHGKPMAEGDIDAKRLLAGSEFTVPLNAGSKGRGTADGAIAASTTLWGSGEYRAMSGNGGGVEWDGELSGIHVGLDSRLRPGVLVGLSASQTRSAIDYQDSTAAGAPTAGSHDIDMTSLHPYLGWRAGGLDLWAFLGYGKGELEITPTNGAKASGDIDMSATGIGGSGEIWQNSATTFRLRGEAVRTALKVAGGADLAAMEAASTRLRLGIEASRSRATAGGGVFAPSFEFGLRYDGGDGVSGTGAEIGGGLRYRHAAAGYSAEGGFRVVAKPGEYEEWGVHGIVALDSGADGQGLSLRISPSYGEVASGIENLWRQGLPESDNAAADDYRARLESRLGYGIPLKAHGVLTPYAEMTTGAADRYRVGLNWRPSSRFTLNLLGERHAGDSDSADHAILLEGEARF